jgi:acetyl esterase
VPATLWRHDGLIHGFLRMGAACTQAQAALLRIAAGIGEAQR